MMQTNGQEDNDKKSENLKQLPDPPVKESWLSRHTKAIIALTAIGSFITTTVLAIIAYLSWTEIQLQRDLAFKQFVVANAPSVRTYATTGFNFSENAGWMTWKSANEGGPVKDFIYKTIIFCCAVEEIKNPETTKVIARTALQDRLRRNENATVKVLVKEKETLSWLRSFIEGNKYGLYLYISAAYTIPPELSLTKMEEKDKTYRMLIWEPYKKSFEGVKPEYEKMFIEMLNKREYLSIDHRG